MEFSDIARALSIPGHEDTTVGLPCSIEEVYNPDFPYLTGDIGRH